MHSEFFVPRGFRDLPVYLQYGPPDQRVDPSERVLWCEAINLPSPKPGVVARVMEATTAQNRRCREPLVHIIVSWAASDRPTAEQMKRALRRIIRSLGLEDYQIYAVAHRGDGGALHIHLMINRVHPTPGELAWDQWQSWERTQKTLRALEREFGWAENPGHLARLPGQQRPDRTKGLSRGDYRTWQRKDFAPEHRPFQFVAQEEVGALLDRFCVTGDRQQLETDLADVGYQLVRASKGHRVVASDGRFVPLCRVHRDAPTALEFPEVARAAALARECARGEMLLKEANEIARRLYRLSERQGQPGALTEEERRLLEERLDQIRPLTRQDRLQAARDAACAAVGALGDDKRLARFAYLAGNEVLSGIQPHLDRWRQRRDRAAGDRQRPSPGGLDR